MFPQREYAAYFVVGDSKGACPLAHDFAEQSVVYYTLCQRCRENAIATGEGKGVRSGRKAGGNLRRESRK